MNGRAFSLRVFPRSEREVAVAVQQALTSNAANKEPEHREVVRAWGLPLHAVMDQVLETLRRAGFKASELSPRRKEPFNLDESAGVRLALLLMAVKPLSKHQRIEEVAGGVRSLSDEEAYYWYSKCADRRAGRRAQHALRVMFSAE
ncbi:MAG: hypothetical protein QME79_12070 [Bacillota bacterium]|nr:hypothetical protein [Bacillota bacterium]